MLKIEIVKTKKQLNQFIDFQYQIYRDSKHFVPPLKMDRYKLLNKDKNPFWKLNDRELFLCWDENKIVGRIAAIENKTHNSIHNDNIGFFGFYESINDIGVAKLLLETVSDWCKKKGFNKILGPVNPHLNDDSPGFLLEGHDDDPIMLLAYTQKYYIDLMEKAGLVKAKDLFSFKFDLSKVPNGEKLKRINEKTKVRHNLSIRKINFKKFNEDYLIIQDIFNKAWEKNWGQVPLTKEDFEYIASDLKSLVHKDFISLAFKDSHPIGMAVALPDMNELFKPMQGGFGNFGASWNFIKYLLFKKSTIKRLRIFILGVLPEYDHTGATAMLYQSLIDNSEKHNFRTGEMAWVLEDNEKMNKAAEMLGGQKTKIFRLFEKVL